MPKKLIKSGNGKTKISDNPKSATSSVPASAAMEQLRADYTGEEKAHRKKVRKNICTAYKLGLELQRSAEQWMLFCKKDWEGISGAPSNSDQCEHAVRYALKFMVGSSKDAQKDASFYYRAIKRFVDEEYTPEELEEELKGKSLRELAKEQAKGKNLPAPVPKLQAKEKETRTTPSTPATTKSDMAREPLQRPSKLGRVSAPCVLKLKEKKLSAFLSTPIGDKITIEGKLIEVGSQIAITVKKVTHHKTDASSP